MREIEYSAEFCVIGGGLSGLCAAVAAARHGVKTVLMHDRIVLGGNASSEVRMWICGAKGNDNRETGIIEEIILENFYQNPAHKYSIWDSVLYEKAMLEPNLTLILNCSCLDAKTENNTIKSVRGWKSDAQTFYNITADYFADCSGDSILAPLTGAQYMYGREAREEYNESIAPQKADKKTMGMSCLLQLRETQHKTEFTPPAWAYEYECDDMLPEVSHNIGTNFWWIETGGMGDCLHDTDQCRYELLKIIYGVWDHMKNKGEHGADNWEIEWIGFLPAKRESIRYKGAYIINQNDVESGGRFEDVVAYGGWSMDNHFPEGFYYREGHPTIHHKAPSPWGITFRSLYSKNIKNLLFAGRNISVTHTALSSSRVMATCAILGQAVGTAVSVMKEDKTTSETIDIKKLQNILMDDDCYLPSKVRKISDITKNAYCSVPIVKNGKDRGEENCWRGRAGDFIEYVLNKPENVSKIRFIFDSDLNRSYRNMPCHIKLKEDSFVLPKTLIKSYRITLRDENGIETVINVKNNHQRFVCHEIKKTLSYVKFEPMESWGAETFNVFSFELQ